MMVSIGARSLLLEIFALAICQVHVHDSDGASVNSQRWPSPCYLRMVFTNRRQEFRQVFKRIS